MKILVINSGSSSIKYKCFEMPDATVIASGVCEKIGESSGKITHKVNGNTQTIERKFADHAAALEVALDLLAGDGGALEDRQALGGVGHRLVHGGEAFSQPVIIDDKVIAAVRDNIPLAPLHNPPNLLGVEVSRQLLPNVPQVGVFDTAFHQTMEPEAFLYALPYELYTDGRIRRYGFHGTSHAYVAKRAAAVIGRPLEEINLITCHLGNGASMAAIKQGQSVDTSMGFTPLEGLVMGTRTGDFDPAIVMYLMNSAKMSAAQINQMINKHSGLLGLSGKSNDMREVEAAANDGDKRARLALDVYCYRIRKYIGSMMAVLGHVDGLVFTAGIGENNPTVRQRSIAELEEFGFGIDEDKNTSARGVEADISAADAAVRTLVIPTNEELAIAEQTYSLINNS